MQDSTSNHAVVAVQESSCSAEVPGGFFTSLMVSIFVLSLMVMILEFSVLVQIGAFSLMVLTLALSTMVLLKHLIW